MACANGDHQWCAELLTHVIRVNRDDMEARKLKAEALRQLAYKTINTNWRDWYLTAARELDGTLPNLAVAATMALASPDIQRALPKEKYFEALAVRLDPEKSADAHQTVEFRVGRDVFTVEIRRGIAEVRTSKATRPDATVTLTADELYRAQLGAGKVEGDPAALAAFWSYFDPPMTSAPALVVR